MADTLTITDNRTGKTYELPIQDGTIRADALRQIRTSEDDFGLMTYDPAFMNTASCRSAITLIDGDKGILRYRGYPIEQLAESSTYLEVAYLLLNGELPNQVQLEKWTDEVTNHTYVHEFLREAMKGFRYDAHAMGKMVSMLGALSTFYPESKNVRDPKVRHEHIVKIIAKMPTIAAWAHRHSVGRPYVYPDNELSYTGNFLNMLFRMAEPRFKPNPVLSRALDILFILHADHEQNCSTNAARAVGSAETDPYSTLAAASAALYGPLHGGANEAVLRMLRLALLAAVADPLVTVASQLLHGPVVLAIYLIPPMYLNLKAPPGVRNGVQGLYAMLCFGLARLSGSVAAGYAAEVDLAWAFVLGATLSALAFIWLLLRFHDPDADAALRARDPIAT